MSYGWAWGGAVVPEVPRLWRYKSPSLPRPAALHPMPDRRALVGSSPGGWYLPLEVEVAPARLRGRGGEAERKLTR